MNCCCVNFDWGMSSKNPFWGGGVLFCVQLYENFGKG